MLVNDTCISLNLPFTIAGVLRFHGQIMTTVPSENTACYRCVFGDISDVPAGLSCSQAGVIGLIPGILGCLEANEAIKSILDVGDLITNKILYVDLLRNTFNFVNIVRDENCIACGNNAKDLVETYNYNIEQVCR